MVIGCKASSQCRSCVAVDEDDIGFELGENLFHSLQNGDSDIGQT